MPGPLVAPIALGIGQILGNLFGNLFGASKQASAARDANRIQTQAALRAAELEKQSLDEALAYQKSIDARDYRDWLTREARDRKDFEISEQRKAPYRALGDSAVRTLADYIRVPGMRPAQEIAPQTWSDPHHPQVRGPVSTTMPVGGNLRAYANPMQPPTRSLRDLTMYS